MALQGAGPAIVNMEIGVLRRILKRPKRWHLVAIMAIAGHVSKRMLGRYSHVRLEAKRAVLQRLSRQNPAGYGTNHVTKSVQTPVYADLIARKEMVGACGFEPQTPTVSR